MGEVYRAHDARLGRDVALKVLSERLAAEPEAAARFEREARAAAALSHPGIVTIHDVGVDGGRAWAALELLEGQTLRQRLVAGPLAPAQALKWAQGIADALAAAHARGLVHRDLKPENLFVTRDGRAKILDFGLVLTGATGPAASVADSPTGDLLTQSGLVLGTLGYLSPEQARGEKVDTRSDLFSLGCVLHEMLTGRAAFRRGSVAETLAAILHDEADLSALPAAAARIVERCLRKDREERWQSARDLAFALADAAEPVSGLPSPAPAARRAWAVAALALALAALGLAAWRLRPAGPPATTAQVVTLTPGRVREFSPVLSPDGKFVVYLGDDGQRTDLWVKFLAGGPAANLTAGSGLVLQSKTAVGSIDLSPDGSQVAVRAIEGEGPGSGSVWLVPAPLVGPPRKLASGTLAGMRWSPDGARVAFVRAGLVQGDAIAVARADGTDERVLVPAADGLHLHQPAWSTDGAWVYFTRSVEIANEPPIEIWRVPSGGGATGRVIATEGLAMNPEPLADGALVYAGGAAGDLMGLLVRAPGSPVARRLTLGAGEYAEPRASRDGRRLVCTARRTRGSVVRVAVEATEERQPATFAGLDQGDEAPSTAASGERVAFVSRRNGRPSLWVLDGPGQAARPLTSGADLDAHPALSPDGASVAFVSHRNGRRGLWVAPATGGPARRLLEADVIGAPSWSPDGRRLAYSAAAGGQPALWLVSVDDPRPARLGNVAGRSPTWSPRQDVIAYVSENWGVRFVSPSGGPVPEDLQASVQLTNELAWSHDGSRLATGSAPGSRQGELWLLDLSRAPLARRRLLLLPSRFTVHGLAWAPDDRSLLVGLLEEESQVLLFDGLP